MYVYIYICRYVDIYRHMYIDLCMYTAAMGFAELLRIAGGTGETVRRFVLYIYI